MSLLVEANQPNAVAVIIATRGRPDIVRGLIGHLGRQSVPPDHIFVVGSEAADLAGLDDGRAGLTLHIGRTGSTQQRNDGLALAGDRFAFIVFFDDDFVPSRFWLARMVELFARRPAMASLTGTVLADGSLTAGISPEAAAAMVEDRDAAPVTADGLLDDQKPYGCNMAFRHATIRGLLFDERLVAYAWLEDADFGGQVARRGRLCRADALWGVHLGTKTGRVPGVRLGYAQIANTAYFARKGTLPIAFLAKIALGNVAKNMLRALWPEPFVDRWGRLRGNIIALGDVMRGRITPARAAEL